MSLGAEAQAALDEVLAREDPTILGVVLSGSRGPDGDGDRALRRRRLRRADRRGGRGSDDQPQPVHRRDPADAGRPRGRAVVGRRRVRLPLGLLLHAGAPRRHRWPDTCGPAPDGDAHRGGGAADAAARRPARRLRQHGLPRPQVRPRRPPARAPARRRRVRALVAGRRLHPGGPGPALQQVPRLGAPRAPAERPGVVGRAPAAAGRGGPRRRRGRRAGGVRRRRARVPRLGRAARRPRPPRAHRGLGRRAGRPARRASGGGTWPAGARRRPPTRSRRGWTARTGSV